MKLKNYQETTLRKLAEYAKEVKKYPSEKAVGIAFIDRTEKQYNFIPELGGSPFVCVKVPTGGGKTLIASYSVGVIFDEYLGERNDRGLAMWFVPSDAIKKQTLNCLKNRKHPFRAAMDERFSNHVEVFDLKEAKAIKKEDVANNLCVVVTTLSAFRREDKEWLKVFQDNGALMGHFEGLPKEKFDFLQKDADDELIYSLANVIRTHNPLVIIDEGHNAQTELSFAMLKELNPVFVLEFTATPRPKSNVLVNVSAQELKTEKMIKMPLYLANKVPWQDTIIAGIEKLRELEKAAKKNPDYIRPMMLIQAEQEKEDLNKVCVSDIKEFLLNEAKLKIADDEIAIKTSKTDNLPDGETLSSEKCRIKYIITVNALREGWDCPFAYILVSVSKLGARLSVEQTIGRIMRLPYVKEHKNPLLNSGYIFAATSNFSETSRVVIEDLKSNGYEDIVVAAGAVSLLPILFKRAVEDEDIELPYLSVEERDEPRELDFVADLIGSGDILKKANSMTSIFSENGDIIEKIDLVEGELIRNVMGKLGLAYYYKDTTKEELLAWFINKISRSYLTVYEMRDFLERVVSDLLKNHGVAFLSRNRFRLKEAIDSRIEETVAMIALESFDELKRKEKIGADVYHTFGPTVELSNFEKSVVFRKHLYERAGAMNKEELVLAEKIDGLPNVLWWFRNKPNDDGFYIQGWKQGRFYPDFIVKTNKGKYFVIEYKGGHLVDAPDEKYKTKIGELWAELAGENHHFRLCEKKNIDEIIGEIVGRQKLL